MKVGGDLNTLYLNCQYHQTAGMHVGLIDCMQLIFLYNVIHCSLDLELILKMFIAIAIATRLWTDSAEFEVIILVIILLHIERGHAVHSWLARCIMCIHIY